MSIYVLISQIFIIYSYFDTHCKHGQNAYMLISRLACNRVYTLRFGKISQCRLEQRLHTLFTLFEIHPTVQFTTYVFRYDFVDFTV